MWSTRGVTLGFVFMVAAAACGDDDGEATTAAGGAGGAGGDAGPSCTRSDECTPVAGACSGAEVAITQCADGRCETVCEAGFAACSECTSPAECMFTGDLCPPPNTDPFQSCFEGKCSEICGAASDLFCLTDGECPQVQCPGNDDAIAQCLGGGCVDAAARCCES